MILIIERKIHSHLAKSLLHYEQIVKSTYEYQALLSSLILPIFLVVLR